MAVVAGHFRPKITVTRHFALLVEWKHSLDVETDLTLPPYWGTSSWLRDAYHPRGENQLSKAQATAIDFRALSCEVAKQSELAR